MKNAEPESLILLFEVFVSRSFRQKCKRLSLEREISSFQLLVWIRVEIEKKMRYVNFSLNLLV